MMSLSIQFTEGAQYTILALLVGAAIVVPLAFAAKKRIGVVAPLIFAIMVSAFLVMIGFGFVRGQVGVWLPGVILTMISGSFMLAWVLKWKDEEHNP